MVLQQADEILHMRCFARTTDGDITDGDDRHLEGTALQDTHLEEHVPESDAQSVEPAERTQFLININKVAFHVTSF
jgi:hypothetical protein